MVDYFLKIAGINGASAADRHKGEIDVESFSWGATQTASMAATAGGAAGKAAFSDISFTAAASVASPSLFAACASGQHVPEAVLIGEHPGGGRVVMLSFHDLLISSYQTMGGPDGPIDSFAFRYGSVQFEHTTVQPSGKPGPAVKAGWDVTRNRSL
jgi:type VI secretion system secreted protein Hcp